MATKYLSDITGGLPLQARGINNTDALRHLNDDVRNDLRDEIYQTFDETFTDTQTFPIVLPNALTATLSDSAGNVDAGIYEYGVTYVSAYGESKVGKYSAIITVSTAGQGDLTAIPVGPTGTTSRKIYRRQNRQGDMKLLTTLSDNTTTTYTDNTAQASLGAIAPTGFALATDYYDYKSVKYSGLDVPVVSRASTSTYPDKFYCWFDFKDNPDGTSSSVFCVPDDFSYTGTIQIIYRKKINDADDTNALPYPLALHDRLLPILRLGVAFYHLSELPGEENEALKVGDRYDTARANLFVGDITQTF